MTALIESIKKMSPNGHRLELPTHEQLTNYAEVKKALQLAGGKYSRCGFTFADLAQTVKDRLTSGEAVNDKKKFQFFPTPPKVVDMLIASADIRKGMLVLEPSAGQGAIVDAIIEKDACAMMIEFMPENVKVLNRKYETGVQATDFLSMNPEDSPKYDRIVANPPFTRNQDVDHVKHMYRFLALDGILVSIMGTSWIRGSQKKQIIFRDWLDGIGAEIEDIPAGMFKESGTNIATVMVKIRK